MADVYGFGEYKAKAYGKPFIEAIKQYASDNVDLPFPDAATLADVPSAYIPPKPTSYMEQQKQLHANAYAHWDDEEDKKLTEYYRQGLSTSEIASLMNRNTGGISSRIKKLGLREDDNTLSTTFDSTAINKESDENKRELDRLFEMQAYINRQIEELRKKMGQ